MACFSAWNQYKSLQKSASRCCNSCMIWSIELLKSLPIPLTGMRLYALSFSALIQFCIDYYNTSLLAMHNRQRCRRISAYCLKLIAVSTYKLKAATFVLALLMPIVCSMWYFYVQHVVFVNSNPVMALFSGWVLWEAACACRTSCGICIGELPSLLVG